MISAGKRYPWYDGGTVTLVGVGGVEGMLGADEVGLGIRARLSGGCGSAAGDLIPDGEAITHFVPVVTGGELVAAGSEVR